MNNEQLRTSLKTSQIQISKLFQQIIHNVQQQISLKIAIQKVPSQMARQLISVQSQSIHQIKSNNPNLPYLLKQQNQPFKILIDTIRPFSARIQKSKKLKPIQHQNKQNIIDHANTKISNTIHTTHSFKSAKPITAKTNNKKQENSFTKKDHNQALVLPLNNDEILYDGIFDKLRQKKGKIEEYEKSKQTFMRQISKQNQQNTKKQLKFASSMNRKDYTYTFTGQILQILPKKLPSHKKFPKNNITTFPTKLQNHSTKPQIISVKFNKKQQNIKNKDCFFVQNNQNIKTEFFSLTNTGNTKFVML